MKCLLMPYISFFVPCFLPQNRWVSWQPSHIGSCQGWCSSCSLLCLCFPQTGLEIGWGQWPLHWRTPRVAGHPPGDACCPSLWHWGSLRGLDRRCWPCYEVPHGRLSRVSNSRKLVMVCKIYMYVHMYIYVSHMAYPGQTGTECEVHIYMYMYLVE